MKTNARLGISSLLLALCPLAVQAFPISYSFSTQAGPSPGGDPTLSAFFSGLSVNGTFSYDSATAATGTVPAGSGSSGSTVYGGSLTNLMGSVGGNTFSDAIGASVVGDDKFQTVAPIPNPPPPADILSLRGDPLLTVGAPAIFYNFTGFNVAGFTLVNVRMFWIEGQLGITDFLSSDNLPGTLPGFQGRLALDFTPTANPGALSFLFFDGLTVTQVPEPGTLSLLSAGLLGFGLLRRRRRTA